MSVNINQFGLTTIQGAMDMQVPGTVISCQVDAAQSPVLVPGQAVKLATTAGGVPKVLGLAANTDYTFGFVAYDSKDVSYAANARLQVAICNSVMYMTAGALIARATSGRPTAVEVVYTTTKVITAAGINPIVGWTMDYAAADGDLVRVYIITPAITQPITLNSLSDVTITSPTNGQVLEYSTGVWVNATDNT